MNLEQFGWNDFFAEQMSAGTPGRVASANHGRFYVWTEDGEVDVLEERTGLLLQKPNESLCIVRRIAFPPHPHAKRTSARSLSWRVGSTARGGD